MIGWIDKAIEAAKKLDALFVIVAAILKKHWWLVTLIGMGLFIWWAFTLPQIENEEQPYYDTTYYEEQTIDTIYYEQ